MKILMLVNWKVEYTDTVPEDRQPPDYVVKGQLYWFFRYFPKDSDIQVDVVDIRSLPWLEKFEKEKLRFYIWQTLKVIPGLKRYDLVLSHGMQSGILLCLIRRIFGKGGYKHIVFDIGAFNSARESGKGLRLMQFAGKSLDGVIYHTRSQRTYYEKCHPWLLPKARFITFGADTEFFRPEKCSMPQQTEHTEKQYILCLGYNKRDWNTLLCSYQMLKEKRAASVKDIALRLIGNPEVVAGVEGVEIMGQISVIEMKKQIQNALFCVLPLQQFNYSYGQMTLLQQMAFGKAVIVADVSSIQVYKEKDNLLTYEPENRDELTTCMEELILNQEKRELTGRKAEESVCRLYNERNMAKEVYGAIVDLMEN